MLVSKGFIDKGKAFGAIAYECVCLDGLVFVCHSATYDKKISVQCILYDYVAN